MSAIAAQLPPHISLTIEHNPHAACYQTVDEWIKDHGPTYEVETPRGVTTHDRIKPEDVAAIRAAGEVWTIRWRRTTPGRCWVAAATLERALELAWDNEWEDGR